MLQQRKDSTPYAVCGHLDPVSCMTWRGFLIATEYYYDHPTGHWPVFLVDVSCGTGGMEIRCTRV
jgi:hypothetical protein